MTISTTKIATAYYQAMAKKDVEELGKYVHPDVHFKGMVEVRNKQEFLGALKGMLSHSTSLEIRAVVGDEQRAMVAYDLIFPAPIGAVHTAALLGIEDGLVKDIELFFDKSAFKR